jgi:hypothetical protein
MTPMVWTPNGWQPQQPQQPQTFAGPPAGDMRYLVLAIAAMVFVYYATGGQPLVGRRR